MRRSFLPLKTLFAFVLLAMMAGCTSARPFAADAPPRSGMRIEVVPPSAVPSDGSIPRQPSSEQQNAAPYTIAWMSDTQYYCRNLPNIYFAMTRYLQDNREKLNLGYVVHTGDIVDSASNEAQWAVARQAMDSLSGIPYGVLAGNHDVGNMMDYGNFRKYFGETLLHSIPITADRSRTIVAIMT